MKNLELLELDHHSIEKQFENVQTFAFSQDSIYFVKDSTLFVYNLGNNTINDLLDFGFGNVICIKHLSIENVIFIYTSNGFVVVELESCSITEMVDLNSEIAAIDWNVAEERFAIVYVNGEVEVFCYSNFEYETCTSLGKSHVEAKVPDTVYVGWGSKDTQFRGSEGKLKKKQSLVEIEPVADQKPIISWRGNGEMFVVNYWTDNKRMFTVFDDSCKAMYRSVDCPGLQPPIAWRPTGNIVAGLVVVDSKPQLVIFEKNGQERFKQSVDFGDVEIKAFKWSPCTKILSVHSKTPTCDNIHLLTFSNWKFYLKQTLTFNHDNPLIDYDWLSSDNTYTLRVVTKEDMLCYIFTSKVSSHNSLCAVIDGKDVLLSDFAVRITPPPYIFLEKITLKKQANFVFFPQDRVGIVDSDNCLSIYDGENLVVCQELTGVGETVRFPLAYHHFVGLDNGAIAFAGEARDETRLHRLSEGKVEEVGVVARPFRHILPISGERHVTTNLIELPCNLYQNGDHLTGVIKQEVAQCDGNWYNFQLLSNDRFYINDKETEYAVNSFVVADQYLILATKTCELFTFRIRKDVMKGYSNKTLVGRHRRVIEQGASIVCAVPDSAKVVLQMPRGNLETISVRLISIDIVDKMLKSSKWDEAITYIRWERLNWNVLFDLNPERFLREVDQFVMAISTIEELNGICLEFDEVNVLATVYEYWGESTPYPNKLKAIFTSLMEYYERVGYIPYVNNIMVIQYHHFSMAGALLYVLDLFRKSSEHPELKSKVIGAVKTLEIYSRDKEKIFKEVLALYDMDLAHLIADCLKMDPRSYEPQLDRLRSLSEIRRRFEVNQLTNRPSQAIAYLLRCPDATAEEILSFIKKHNVSKQAYMWCPPKLQHFQAVSKAYAHTLLWKGNPEEAGVVLKRAGLLEEALDCFRKALAWKEVFKLLKILGADKVRQVEVATELAEKLVEKHAIKEAAIIYEEYALNYEKAVLVLIENCFLVDAICLAQKYGRNDIIESDIKMAVNKNREELEQTLTKLHEEFNTHKERLKFVRNRRVMRYTHVPNDDDDGEDFNDVNSIISTIASTGSSRYSKSSTASAKNRRREERKKIDLREGGVYEDIALIRALYLIIKQIYEKSQEVKTCCLLQLEGIDTALENIQDFYRSYKKIYECVNSSVGEIWPQHFKYVNSMELTIEERADLENFEHLDMEFRNPPKPPQERWDIDLLT